MKQCKVVYISTYNKSDKEKILEAEINRYLAQGYEIKAVHCTSGDWWYVFLERNI